MPPRAKKTDEEKEADYMAWQQTEECSQIDIWRGELVKPKTDSTGKVNKGGIDNAWLDITDDFSGYLNTKFNMVQALKVPGRKAKCKFQLYCNCYFSIRANVYAYDVLPKGRKSYY